MLAGRSELGPLLATTTAAIATFSTPPALTRAVPSSSRGSVGRRLPPVRPPGVQIRVHGPGRMVDRTHLRLEGPGQVLVEVRVETPGLGLGDASWPWLLGQPVKVEAVP